MDADDTEYGYSFLDGTEPDPEARARRGEKIIILDRGNVEFGYPGAWTVTPDPQGSSS